MALRDCGDTMVLIPYVVRQGDHLRRLAARRGFDADAVWGNSANAEIRARRPSMNMLCPGDILYLPAAKRTWLPVTLGSTNKFVANVSSMKIATVIRYADRPLANAQYRVRELDGLGTLTTDGDGLARFDAPATLERATMDFESQGLSVVLRVGHLDPVDTPSGISQRLSNLDYSAAQPDDPGDMSGALAMFQLDQNELKPDGEPNDDTRKAIEAKHGS